MMGQMVGAKAFMLLQQAAPAVQGAMSQQQFQQQLALEAVRNNSGWGHSAVAVLVPAALFAMIAVIVWLAVRGKQAQVHAQAELQKNLLEKFGSGQEFAAFLESEGGQKFLEQLWSPRASARQRLLKSISVGVIFSVLGLGLLALGLFAHSHRGIIFPAVVFLALGVGFLISAFISNRLLKQWGESAEAGALKP